jgi:CRISPR-associated endonuclease Csn1
MKDKQGNNVNKIRHIKCYTTVKNPLKIKRHTYLSDKEYRQYSYAEIGDLYVMCKYENIDKKGKEYIIYSLYDISENRKKQIEDIPSQITSKKNEYNLTLSYVLKSGAKILLGKKEELQDLDYLSNRLYYVKGFENDGKRIILKRHITALDDKQLGKGESIKDYNELPNKIRCGVNTMNFLLEGKDFVMTPDGKITIKDN